MYFCYFTFSESVFCYFHLLRNCWQDYLQTWWGNTLNVSLSCLVTMWCWDHFLISNDFFKLYISIRRCSSRNKSTRSAVRRTLLKKSNFGVVLMVVSLQVVFYQLGRSTSLDVARTAPAAAFSQHRHY